MTAPIPREDIWFAVFWRRLWAVRVFAVSLGLSFWWFKALQRTHTDYSITYDDYFREKNNA
ncbi:hypothetical protein O7A70_28840 [Mesorhizobium sp. Cs1299R1N1]|uniref:hypothetical protein n=1 Tax=Mesorhizobium sp. Cs1299R1N1 TaxID=3015172 RepID=UPI00301BB03B